MTTVPTVFWQPLVHLIGFADDSLVHELTFVHYGDIAHWQLLVEQGTLTVTLLKRAANHVMALVMWNSDSELYISQPIQYCLQTPNIHLLTNSAVLCFILALWEVVVRWCYLSTVHMVIVRLFQAPYAFRLAGQIALFGCLRDSLVFWLAASMILQFCVQRTPKLEPPTIGNRRISKLWARVLILRS